MERCIRVVCLLLGGAFRPMVVMKVASSCKNFALRLLLLLLLLLSRCLRLRIIIILGFMD